MKINLVRELHCNNQGSILKVSKKIKIAFINHFFKSWFKEHLKNIKGIKLVLTVTKYILQTKGWFS